MVQGQLYKKGKLMTTDGDTLSGLVAVQSDNTFAFKKDKKAERNLFHIKELVGYEMEDESYEQHVVEVIRGNFPEKVRAYLKRVVDGPLVLLEYRGEGIFGSEHVNYYLYNGQDTPYRVNRNPGNFRRSLKIYFREVDDLAQKIKDKSLGYTDLEQIVEEYNTWFIAQAKANPVSEDDEN